MDMEEFIAGKDDNDRRIDRVVRKFLPGIPLSGIYSALRKKRILLNAGKAAPSVRVHTGDRITIDESLLDTLPSDHPVSSRGDLPEILLETPAILGINKPRGLSVHGKGSLESLVYAYLKPTLRHSLSFKPGPLHRLDKDTTGIVFFGKTLEGSRRFSELLKGRTSGKYYIGLFDGVINDSLRMACPVEGKKALTYLYPLAVSDDKTLGCVRIITGRKHQIRVQAAEAGHPLTGDSVYGGTSDSAGYLLHAYAFILNRFDKILGFRTCTAPLPGESAERLARFFGPAMNERLDLDLQDIITKNHPLP